MRSESGYAMAALLVAMIVMSIMMTAAMPVWHQMARREREQELIFRGEQYVRAIRLFQRKNGVAAVPSIDLLVQQRFLRKKYKDPITNDDFEPITLVAAARSRTANAQPSDRRASPVRSGGSPPPSGRPGHPSSGGPSARTTPALRDVGSAAGIIGVVSKSSQKSIREYNGRSHYNEWAFVFLQPVQAPGNGAAASTDSPSANGSQPGVAPAPPRTFLEGLRRRGGRTPAGDQPGRGRGPGPTGRGVIPPRPPR